MIVRQLFDPDTCTYTYLLADLERQEAVLIDPVLEQTERDISMVRELGLSLTHVLETHTHADHVTGAAVLRDRLGATTVTSRDAGVVGADRYVADGECVHFGRCCLEVRATPGHTAGCVTYVYREEGRCLAFTGDALFVRGCGRTDFQEGNPRVLYRSIHQRIYTLPDDTVIYPGHDYGGHTATTVGEEKAKNPRLSLDISEARFVDIMEGLKLPYPKRFDAAVPANRRGGRLLATG